MSGLLSLLKQSLKKKNRRQMWIFENAQYLTMIGSRSYDTYTESSDYDISGFTIPPKHIVFPFKGGNIYGFHTKFEKFDQYELGKVPYLKTTMEGVIYSIVKYFKLVMENNPNMIDTLFTKEEYVLKSTFIGDHVRAHRRRFLHKGAYKRFSGYAYSQLKKCKSLSREGKRKALVKKYGFDIKFAGHIIRLLDEIEQILVSGDVDLTRVNETVKSIHRGEWTLEDVEDYFKRKSKYLEDLYYETKLPEKPDVDFISNLLLECLEDHYGSVDEVVRDTTTKDIVADIDNVLSKYR